MHLFLATCQHLGRLQHILDLPAIEVHLGEPINVLTADGAFRSQEGLPNVAPGFRREVGIVDGDMYA